jgi:hypothetical protein
MLRVHNQSVGGAQNASGRAATDGVLSGILHHRPMLNRQRRPLQRDRNDSTSRGYSPPEVEPLGMLGFLGAACATRSAVAVVAALAALL